MEAIPSAIHLVSGGAAAADHVAVCLYLMHHAKLAGLTVYMPCPFDTNSDCASGYSSTANEMNRLHLAFTNDCCAAIAEDDKTLTYSMSDISLASRLGAKLDHSRSGFLARNSAIADCDYLLAFTWGKGSTPKPGGTLDTWRKCATNKKAIQLHVSLQDL